MAHDAAFITGIRQVRDDMLGLGCGGNVPVSELFGQPRRQYDLERHHRP
jgi:hypothetical protein